METLQVVDATGREFKIPVMVSMFEGQFTNSLARETVPPEQCDHTGYSYSANIALRCGKCGSPLFVPGRFLARRPAAEIARMHQLWRAAGWPEWHNGAWLLNEHWTLVQHPLFTALGGLPVREDRLALYTLEADEGVTA